MHLRKVAICLAVVKHGGTHFVVTLRPVVAAFANVSTATAVRFVARADTIEVVGVLVKEGLGSARGHQLNV